MREVGIRILDETLARLCFISIPPAPTNRNAEEFIDDVAASIVGVENRASDFRPEDLALKRSPIPAFELESLRVDKVAEGSLKEVRCAVTLTPVCFIKITKLVHALQARQQLRSNSEHRSGNEIATLEGQANA